ncbi:putative colanic acid biosynthesis acetyltransferase [Sphingomonas sp. ABOLH]|nr:MAG: putative colanic acid biosynthesis acetyltransferase [Sphingomonas sp.]RSV29559.1 putative colanic acid biosynthesis acetyltransferase [Sphingomonas sp. ABOLH]
MRHLPPPGLRDRLYRMGWNLVQATLFRWSPVPLHAWRRCLLRWFGARIEGGTAIYPTARIWAPDRLTMRQGSCLGSGADCYNVAPVELGRACVVSQKAYLCTASHDIDDPAFTLIGAPIVVGEGAWVAAGAFVGPGVDIGIRAVVAAVAVVTRNVPSEHVVAGNPARMVRERRVSSQPSVEK